MATLLNLVYVPSVILGVSRNIANSAAIQFGVENKVLVPVLRGPSRTSADQYNGGAYFRIADEPMPFNRTTKATQTLPSGAQWWPITG
jgi:hypothetical protein